MKNEFCILRTIGKDRVGIVDDISAVIFQCNCNIEESRMAVLGGEFAVIMLVSGSTDAIDKLQEMADNHCIDGIAMELIPTDNPIQGKVREDRLLYIIESVSFDAPGIVHSVTRLLRSFSINIEDLETETSAAPWTGAPMFHMRVRVSIKRGASIPKIKNALEDLGMEEGLDIRIKALGIEESIL